MTIFDYLVIFVLIASIVISTMRGLVKEVLSLAGWVIAFVVANAYGPWLAAMLPESLPGAVVRLIVAFIALFIGVLILMALLTMAINALIEAGGLSFADRGLGALFGFGRGIVIVLAGVILCGMTSMPKQDFWQNALLSPMAESGVRTVKPFLPAAMAEHVHF
ncbi:CvpA family protein [Duganella sp. Root1480D1]|uniref:CvpA family protein n=1 Tax=Duganella sp. Root1480D1 TaxID=1736471 RepID=UPI00070EDC48|nr:CvpA family protein [Duganella sp. Root1480D1]KQZ45285.1 colicin V production protein [Duganella sp. Root1480D1]